MSRIGSSALFERQLAVVALACSGAGKVGDR